MSEWVAILHVDDPDDEWNAENLRDAIHNVLADAFSGLALKTEVHPVETT